jgi:hypothetical protein
LTLLTFFLGAASVRGDFHIALRVEETSEANGLFRYEYTLTNLADSSIPASSFALDVAPSAELQSLQGPSGWDITYSIGDSQALWLSRDTPFDLLPGDNALFSFTSPLNAVPQGFLVVGIDPATFEISTSEAQIAGPGVRAVSEPMSITLVGLGGLHLLGYASRRRRRAGLET